MIRISTGKEETAAVIQKYDQCRLRLFAVVFFLVVMAANLRRYLVFDGLYLWDARLRWQECAYVLHGLNPFDVMHSRAPSIESIGWLDASLGGTVPWAYVLGNLINPGFLPYDAMCVYILALDFIAPLVTAVCMGRFLLRHHYVQDKYMATLAALLVFAPSMWANAVLFGNQSGIVCCCVMLSMCVLDKNETLAGLLLAVAMCKPQVAFVFLFPLLCKKRWKAITVTSGTVLGSWLLAAILTESSPFSMLTDIMNQGLSYNTSYYGLFNFLLGFGVSTKVVLLLNVAVGGVILLLAAAWMFRKKMDNDWLLWYAVTAIVSVMWFYKQSHDYIILALPAIAIFCLPHITLPAWGSILILLVDVIAFAVPKAFSLLCGLPKDVVSPWAKLAETLAIMATLYYVFRSAQNYAQTLQQLRQGSDETEKTKL